MHKESKWPKTIKNATERFIAQMSDEDKQRLRGARKEELAKFNFGMGVFIRNKFGLSDGNDQLMKACALTQQGDTYNIFYSNDPDSAAGIIIEAVWNELKSVA
jgi:predicted deacetylase